MERTLKEKLKKSVVLVLSVCMMLTGMLILPASAYATDDTYYASVGISGGFDVFYIAKTKAYYKNDGSTGTASNYNYYFNGSKLYVKNAECDTLSLMGTGSHNLEFIGESKINGIDTQTTDEKLYIEGTNNGKINIGASGIKLGNNLNDSYIGIHNVDMTIKPVGTDGLGISAKVIKISNSNVKITSSSEDSRGMDCDKSEIENSTLDITANMGIGANKLNVTDGKISINAVEWGFSCLEGKIESSTLNIAANIGIFAGNLNITGGKLTINAKNLGINAVKLAEYANSGTAKFNGGTYIITGTKAGITAPNMVITGGSVYANSLKCDFEDLSKVLVPTLADETTPVYLTTIRLAGVSSSKKITSLTTSSKTYGTKDIYTDAAGKIYLYLPAGAKVTGAKIGTDEYTGSIVTKNDNSASGTFVKIGAVGRPSSVSTRLYGYDDVYVSWGSASGATGYRVYYKKSTWSNYRYYKTTGERYMKFANLADGGKYTFMVKAYRVVNGKTYYGSYSTSNSIYTLKKLGTPAVYKASRNYVKVKWTNISGETGYQIARSRYKTRSYSIVKTANYRYSSATIKTTRNRTYYYKIRAYKTVNGNRIYGPWSSLRAYNLR